MQKKKRLISLTMFDLLKGTAMLLVIFIHSMAWNFRDQLIWKTIYSVIMPVFFITSGYWLKKKAASEGIKTSCKYLLKQYIFVMIIINVIGAVHRFYLHDMTEWLHLFLIPSLLVKMGNYSRIGPMWFIFALFVAWCLFYLVINIKNEKIQIALAVVSAVIGGALIPLGLPFQIAQGLLAFFFVYSGYFIKKKKLLEKKIHPAVLILLLVLWIPTIIYGTMDMGMSDVKYGALSAFGSVCGSFLVIKAFLYLNLVESRFLSAVFSMIRWVGRYSNWIFCIHSIEMTVIPWRILFKYVDQFSAVGCLTQFMLRCIGIAVTCILVEKIQKHSKKKGSNV